MQFKYVLLALCLLSVSAIGQIQTQTQSLTPIRGIKVFSSSFDLSIQTAKLDFMNDSPYDITAWGYCLRIQNLIGDNVPHMGCAEIDTLRSVTERKFEEQTSNKEAAWDCSSCHVIHPGEHKVIVQTFSPMTVANAEIDLNLVVYSNGQFEANSRDGLVMHEDIAKQRLSALKTFQELVDIGKRILADESNPHPTVTMIEELQSSVTAKPGLATALRQLKRPEWHKANGSEFIPKDERGYLQKFVTAQQFRVQEFSKHQIPEVTR